MVAKTALERIMNFVEAERLTEMKKWSQRSRRKNKPDILTRSTLETVNKIRKLLILFSGNDISSLLKGF